MDFFWHINFEEMLGGLTVAAFFILLAAAIVVVSSMVLLPLIDLAFDKIKPTTKKPRHHDARGAEDESWQRGRPWLRLRSDLLRPEAAANPAMSAAPISRAGAGALRLFSPAAAGALSHTTSLIKRTKTATQSDRHLIVPRNDNERSFRGGEVIQQPASPDPVATIPHPPRAA